MSLMGFKPLTSGVGSDCSTNWATTAAQYKHLSWEKNLLARRLHESFFLHQHSSGVLFQFCFSWRSLAPNDFNRCWSLLKSFHSRWLSASTGTCCTFQPACLKVSPSDKSWVRSIWKVLILKVLTKKSYSISGSTVEYRPPRVSETAAGIRLFWTWLNWVLWFCVW